MRCRPAIAVLLAAGRGKRLRPYTDQMPKPLLPINGRPILDFVLRSAALAGIQTVCLVTHHLSEQIEQVVGDGSIWGLKAVYCRQPELDGTAHALQTAVSTFPALFIGREPFLLTATDYIFPADYLANLIDAYLDADTDITLSLKKLPWEEIIASSSVSFKQNGHISQIIEKPSPDQISTPYSASLTFVLPGSTIDYLGHMKPSPRGEFEIQNVINHMLQDGFTASGLAQETPLEWDKSLDRIKNA